MAIGSSVFLIALGAILAFAVDATVQGLDIDVVGIILMVAGAIGLLTSMLWVDRARRPSDTTIVEERHTERV